MVSTSFLGLRRYLRQRQVEMPISLSAIWIGAGIIGVFAILFAVSLLPLPSGSLGFLDLPIQIETTTKLKPSRFGWGQEGTEQDSENAAKTTKQSEDSKKSDDTTKSPQKAASSDKASQSNEKTPSPPKKPSAEEPADQQKQADSKRDATSKSQDPQAKPPSDSSSRSISLSGGLSNLIRWIVSLLLILFIVVLILRYRDELALMLRDLAAWWRGLFGVKEEESNPDAAATSSTTPIRVALKSFSDFQNPFASKGVNWNAAKIVRHTFEAMEAWGRERAMPRSEQETPEEFLRRLAAKYPDQSESILRLMQLYNRLAYANAPADATEVKQLSSLWNWLRTTHPGFLESAQLAAP